MQKFFFVFMLLLFLPFFTFAQDENVSATPNSPETVRLFWNEEKSVFEADPKSLKKGEQYLFVFEGVNPAFYTAKINAAGGNYKPEPPSILKTYSIGPGFEARTFTNNKEMADHLVALYKIGQDKLAAFKEKSLEFYTSSKQGAAGLPVTSIPADFKANAEAIKKGYTSADDLDNLVGYIMGIIAFQESIFEFLDHYIESGGLLVGDENGELTSAYLQISAGHKRLQREKEKLVQLSKFVQTAAKTDNAQIEHKAPFYVKTDYSTVSITLVDQVSKDTVLQQSLELPTKNRWSIEFSSGIFVNGLVQTSYFLAPRDSDPSLKNICMEPSSAANVAFGGLAHWSYNIGGKTKIGPAVGAALSPFDGKTRFMAGLSLAQKVDKNGALAFSGGWAWTSLDLISTQAVEAGDKFTVPASVEAVPTYKAIQGNWFVGLTYYFEKRAK